MIVLDASALLAFLLREPGHEEVAAELSQACMSTVNLSESLARMVEYGIEPRDLRPRLDKTGLRFIDLDTPQAVIVAELRNQMRKSGLGIADCCCLGLGLHMALPVMTADRAWTRLGLALTIRLIR